MPSASSGTPNATAELAPLELTPIQLRAFLAKCAAWPVTAVAGSAQQRRLTIEVAGTLPFRATVAPDLNGGGDLAVAHGELPPATDVASARGVLDACRDLATRLRQADAIWPMEPAPPAREPLNLTQAAEVSRELAGDSATQWPLLAQWAALVTARTGAAPRWWRQDQSGTVALLVTLPRLPDGLRSEAHLLARLGEGLGDGRSLPGWAAQLGFGVDAAGVVDTVPTPASFVALVRARLGRPPAFVPVLAPNAWFVAWERPWLEAMCRGEALINLPRPVVGRALGPWLWQLGARALPGVRAALHALVVVTGHDLTLHCLPQHRIATEDREALCGPIRTALARCPGPAAPDALARFFENDLTRHCQAIWRQCQTPGDFDVLWRERWPDVVAARDRRLGMAARLGRMGGWLPMQQWLPGAGR